MNNVFLIGKVISDIEYKFIYDRFKIDNNDEKYKHIAIARCYIKLQNSSIIEIYGYDEIADILYREIRVGSNAFFEGSLDSNGKIKVKDFENVLYIGI